MNDFTTGSPAKQILIFSIPMLLGNLLQQFYSMADALIVGRFVSGNALAAVGSSASLLNFLVAVIVGLTTGASVVISQFFGAKKASELKKTISTSVISLGVLTVIVTSIGIFGADFFMDALLVPDEIRADSKLYMQIFMAGGIFLIYYNMYMAYMRALGDSKTPLYFLMLSVTLNVFLDLLFVAGFGMGVAGAAIATVVSQAVACVITYIFAAKKIPVLKVEKLEFDKTIFSLILKFSIPTAIQLSLTSIGQLSITRLVNSLGSAVVAGYAAAIKIENIAMMPLSNLSAAISTFVGQNMGADLEERAKKGLFSGMGITLCVGAVLTGVVLLAARTLMGQFVSPADANASEIIAIGAKYLSIMSMFYLIFGVFFSFNGFFRGAGDPVIVMILTISSLTIRVICAYYLKDNFGMGVDAVAWSIPIGWTLCTIAAAIYYKTGKWRGKSVVKAIESKQNKNAAANE